MDDVIVVNEHDEVIGLMKKDIAHTNGTPHRISVVYVQNSSDEFLVQVRMDGILDHSAAGHVHPGESYEDAAQRELFEELGISGVELQRIGHGVSHNETNADDDVRSHVFDIFACTAEPGLLQEDEVKGVYWARAEEVLEDMHSGKSGAIYAGGFRASLPIFYAFTSSSTD